MVRDRAASWVAGCPSNSACFQLSLTATGSATPLNSTTIASNSRFPPWVRRITLVNNSSAREQHAHPFCSSTTPSAYVSKSSSRVALLLTSAVALLAINLASMFTAATSLTMVPILMLELFSKRCLSVDVLPEPRNPARRNVGIGLVFESWVGSGRSAPFACDVEEVDCCNRGWWVDVATFRGDFSVPFLGKAVAIGRRVIRGEPMPWNARQGQSTAPSRRDE
mmetsp:Transcript_5306/g.13269  ORF Transcript_5306/g.13269 Transcript_5306/m.13269 type:complete len:223 (+) Transcript_5306:2833-3501(+)